MSDYTNSAQFNGNESVTDFVGVEELSSTQIAEITEDQYYENYVVGDDLTFDDFFEIFA